MSRVIAVPNACSVENIQYSATDAARYHVAVVVLSLNQGEFVGPPRPPRRFFGE
jgi:hypothetical protein